MQVLHWLFKSTQDQQQHTNGKDAKSVDLILYKNRSRGRRRRSKRAELLNNKYLKPFVCLCRNDVAEACFYTTLNLRRVTTPPQQQKQKWRHSMYNNNSSNQTPRGQIVDSAHVGNKVLPITTDSTLSFSNNTINNKTKTISRMKELLRWAAATKSDNKGNKFIGRKVLQFRNRNTVKSVAADDDLNSSIESPKISFKWETESCSACSMVSFRSTPVHRKGNWITTDSEFVVLEL